MPYNIHLSGDGTVVACPLFVLGRTAVSRFSLQWNMLAQPCTFLALSHGTQGIQFAHCALCTRCVKNRLFWTRFPQYCGASPAIVVVWPNMVTFSQCMLQDIIFSTSSPSNHFLILHGSQYWVLVCSTLAPTVCEFLPECLRLHQKDSFTWNIIKMRSSAHCPLFSAPCSSAWALLGQPCTCAPVYRAVLGLFSTCSGF